MKVLKIKWVDACGDYAEMTKEELMKYQMPVIESVGFLIFEDEQTIKLASFIAKDFVRNWIVIPKAMIKVKTVLSMEKKEDD